MNAGLAQTFDSDALGYDTYRPSYPEQVFEAIFDYARLSPDAKSLEIGAGTGQATQAVLLRMGTVDALEPGEQLSKALGMKFSGFPNFNVKQCTFEEFQSPLQTYELIYSASAFHWVPRGMAYQKAFELLRPGGTLALFWYSFSVNRAEDESHQALQRLFEAHDFGMTEQSHDPERYTRKQNSLRKRGFVDVDCKLFRSAQLYSPAQLLGLLSTTSRYRMLPPKDQHTLSGEIQQVLGEILGVWLDLTIDLYLGKRPAKR